MDTDMDVSPALARPVNPGAFCFFFVFVFLLYIFSSLQSSVFIDDVEVQRAENVELLIYWHGT